MITESVLELEVSTTILALEGSFSRMSSQVDFKPGFFREMFITKTTSKRFATEIAFVVGGLQMQFQQHGVWKFLSTFLTNTFNLGF